MVVKWHWERFSTRELNEAGPQGGHFGILEYLQFKYFHDAFVLEIVDQLSTGIASHNSK